MLQDIQISILIATLNSEKTIKNAIESILNQTYQNFEIVIVDGLSKDKTLEIVESIRNNTSATINIISEKDDGFYDAINKGLKKCNGDLIGILGSDDQFDRKAFEKIIENYEDKIDIYYGNIYKIREVNNTLYSQKAISLDLNNFPYKLPIQHPSVFVNRRWYNNIRFEPKFRICGDYHFLYKSYLNGAQFKYINFEFVYMLFGGLSSNMSQKLKEDFILREEFNGKIFASYIFLSHHLKLLYYKIRRIIADLILSKKSIKYYEEKRWSEFQYK